MAEQEKVKYTEKELQCMLAETQRIEILEEEAIESEEVNRLREKIAAKDRRALLKEK